MSLSGATAAEGKPWARRVATSICGYELSYKEYWVSSASTIRGTIIYLGFAARIRGYEAAVGTPPRVGRRPCSTLRASPSQSRRRLLSALFARGCKAPVPQMPARPSIEQAYKLQPPSPLSRMWYGNRRQAWAESRDGGDRDRCWRPCSREH